MIRQLFLKYPKFNIRCLSSITQKQEILNKVIDIHNRDTRSSLKELFKNDLFIPKYNQTLDQERDTAYKRLQAVCQQNLISVTDFKSNPTNIFSAHEILGMSDGSLCTKFTVQFNLFGGTLFKLGTDKHLHHCNNIDDLSKVGCFGLTELGYGNNAVEMETTAHYDHQTQEFIINTPTTQAQKYWITNGAIHAHDCIVFARLIMPDGTNEGLHGFLVPIRDNKLQVLDNVQIWDLGHKIGLNGIDNAALWFNNVRIPKDNLLDATSQIDDTGDYQSSISDNSKRKRKRFIVLADQLLSGRICIASMTLGSTKMTLDTTIRYAHNRLTVGKDGFSNTPIMNYQLQHNTLVPLIAKTYAYNFFLNYVQQRYQDQTDIDHNELVRLCCIVKPLITWHAENTATVCRERCGGQGFLSANRFGEAIFGAHAGITAEGDNRVIQQKVTKELLTTTTKQNVLRYYGISQSPYGIRLLHNQLTNNAKFRSNQWYLNCFFLRENILLNNLAYELNKHKKRIFDVWMFEKNDDIQDLASAYGHRVVLEQFTKVIDQTSPQITDTLQDLLAVYAITEIKEHIGFFINQGIITLKQYNQMNEHLQELNQQLASQSIDLTGGFGIPDWMHHAPIANNWEEYNRIENNGELDNQAYRQ